MSSVALPDNPLFGAQAPLGVPSVHSGQWMYERIARSIAAFEAKLDPSKEVGARLINFGQNEVISIDDVGYWGLDLIIFYGKNAQGHPVNCSSISLR